MARQSLDPEKSKRTDFYCLLPENGTPESFTQPGYIFFFEVKQTEVACVAGARSWAA